MSKFIGFCFVSVYQLSLALTLVISDIDDTLKVSHVLDRWDSIENATKTQNLFAGMPQVFHQIQVSDPATVFYYVSNAPESLMKGSHGRFLTDNEFPRGTLLLRNGLFEKEHKIKTLRKILNSESPGLMIFFGDNGERDPEIYQQISKEFPNIPKLIFIRQAYFLGQPLDPGQIGFVTAFEVVLHLQEAGVLHSEQVQLFEREFIPFALESAVDEDHQGEEGRLVFPKWMDCRDFQIPHLLQNRNTSLSLLLTRRIENRCQLN